MPEDGDSELKAAKTCFTRTILLGNLSSLAMDAQFPSGALLYEVDLLVIFSIKLS